MSAAEVEAEEAKHQAYLDVIATQAPLSPASDPQQERAAADPDAGSPSAVREAEAQLILRHTHLKESLPGLQERATRFAGHLREAKTEMAEIERLLRAHKRLREPVRRRK